MLYIYFFTFFTMLDTITQSDIKIFGMWVVSILFLLWLLYLNPKNWTVSNKYKRLDFIISLIFIFLAWLAHILKILSVFDIHRFIGILSLWDFMFFLFLCICFLWTWAINVHFRKEINDDTAYRFWVSFFISWWIIIFYLIAESLRFYHFWG